MRRRSGSRPSPPSFGSTRRALEPRVYAADEDPAANRVAGAVAVEQSTGGPCRQRLRLERRRASLPTNRVERGRAASALPLDREHDGLVRARGPSRTRRRSASTPERISRTTDSPAARAMPPASRRRRCDRLDHKRDPDDVESNAAKPAGSSSSARAGAEPRSENQRPCSGGRRSEPRPPVLRPDPPSHRDSVPAHSRERARRRRRPAAGPTSASHRARRPRRLRSLPSRRRPRGRRHAVVAGASGSSRWLDHVHEQFRRWSSAAS